MKHLGTLPLPRRLAAAALTAAALAAGPVLAQGQPAFAPRMAQSAPLTLLLSGPSGDRATLAYSADDGWRMQPGWSVKANADAMRPTPVAFPIAPEPAAAGPVLARPVTVFLDGPTGFTFIYVQDEGWKFVGQIANPDR